ncbi:MAG: DUF3800 domain-containing protein [Thermomicrobiales bacterium]
MADDTVSSRAARIKLERADRILSHLKAAKGICDEIDSPALRTAIDALIQGLTPRRSRYQSLADGRIEPRDRFKRQVRPEGVRIPEYVLCLDECGSHVPQAALSRFPAFCVSGVILSKDAYETTDVLWKAWKAEYLGNPSIIVHEPEVRGCSGHFRRSTAPEREALWEALADILGRLDFACISAVVDLREFYQIHPNGEVDPFLPKSVYLMCIDFILERFVHFLQHRGGDARGSVVAESRGAAEDATVHAEYIRLHIEGTQYVPPGSFRHALRPHMEFYVKNRNHSGLQIADLAARPFAEKILWPTSTPARWDIFSSRLYDGMKGKPGGYGLKIFPLRAPNRTLPWHGPCGMLGHEQAPASGRSLESH